MDEEGSSVVQEDGSFVRTPVRPLSYDTWGSALDLCGKVMVFIKEADHVW